MAIRFCILVIGLLVWPFVICNAQSAATGECAAFASDGSLATGTLFINSDLETRLEQRGSPAIKLKTTIDGPDVPRGDLRQCEEAFSADGRWLATVVAGNRLTVVITDRKTAQVHKVFFSPWFSFHGRAEEVYYYSSFPGGFLPDDSLLLWRYVPHAIPDPGDASNVELRMQRWSIDGELLSDRNLGRIGFGPAGKRQPLGFNASGLLWVPGVCKQPCYQQLDLSGPQISAREMFELPKDDFAPVVLLPQNEKFLSVVGNKAQKAVLLDKSGQIEAHARLPFFPNLLGPLVPDWFRELQPAISSDGQIAAIARTRIAWVLVDTDRDWGSEVVLLTIHPLSVITRVKVGQGGIGTVAVDHRGGVIRLVGYWKERWHDLECSQEPANTCHFREKQLDRKQ